MKPFVRNLMFTSVVAIAVSGMAVGQTSPSQFEQWNRAKHGLPAPTEEARITAEQSNTAYREVTPPQVSAPVNAWFESWYRAKYGRPSPLESAPFQVGPKNLVSPTYRAPIAQAIVRDWITNKEAKRLEAIAESRRDHLELAEFYTAKAANLEGQAAGYEEAATAYRNGPTIKNLMSPTTVGRYEFFAKRMRDEAKFSRILAASHDHMALIASL